MQIFKKMLTKKNVDSQIVLQPHLTPEVADRSLHGVRVNCDVEKSGGCQLNRCKTLKLD